MIFTVYIIMLSYFLLGVIGFYFINRKRDTFQVNKSYRKTSIYFVIVNIICLSIIINPFIFRILAIIIIIIGYYEIFKLYSESNFRNRYFFVFSTLVFSLYAFMFFLFSGTEKEQLFYIYAITCIFDSFSTITGQLWGTKRIFPSISPNKTVFGFAGGIIIAIASGVLFRDLIGVQPGVALIISAGTAVFAFSGDALASVYKRKFCVKDFSNLIPEHGGFLDRFDSLIGGSVWIIIIGNFLHRT